MASPMLHVSTALRQAALPPEQRRSKSHCSPAPSDLPIQVSVGGRQQTVHTALQPTAQRVVCSRRGAVLHATGVLSCLWLPLGAATAFAAESTDIVEELALQAIQAYRARELPRALDLFTSIISRESQNSVWYERRGQVLVDLDRFQEAVADFNKAESLQADSYVSLGLLSNRALAYEGLSEWELAERDYSTCLALSKELGLTGPYILNARGNARASLGRWAEARDDYRAAAEVFQKNRNLQGTIFASANAGLVQMQLGNDAEGLKEIEAVARRAPGSVDMRAALSAIYWSKGDETRAEETWKQACDMINSGQLREGGSVYDGCEKYKDMDWLRRIRRWPPIMVDKMNDFVNLRAPLDK